MRAQVQEIFFKTPHTKQVMMFSATLSPEVRPICRKFCHEKVRYCHYYYLLPPPLSCRPRLKKGRLKITGAVATSYCCSDPRPPPPRPPFPHRFCRPHWSPSGPTTLFQRIHTNAIQQQPKSFFFQSCLGSSFFIANGGSSGVGKGDRGRMDGGRGGWRGKRGEEEEEEAERVGGGAKRLCSLVLPCLPSRLRTF